MTAGAPPSRLQTNIHDKTLITKWQHLDDSKGGTSSLRRPARRARRYAPNSFPPIHDAPLPEKSYVRPWLNR